MITTIETVTVGQGSLDVVQNDDGIWVSVRRACDVLGLDVDGQRRKLADKPWARTALIAVPDPMGRTRQALFIHRDAFPMWLSNINHHQVAPDVVKTLIAFQVEARDVLAAHFGMGWSGPPHRTGSGGAQGSGGNPTTEKISVVAPSSAMQMLQMFDVLSGALRASIAEVAEVRAEVADHKALVEQKTAAALEASQRALASATDAAVIADRAARAGTQARESRRRIDAAVGVITTAIRKHCAHNALPYQRIYREVRSDLGLRRTQDGGPALGRAKLRADQVLRLARTATRLGVPGVGVGVVEGILNGDEPAAPLTKPRVIAPRSDDVVVDEGGVH